MKCKGLENIQLDGMGPGRTAGWFRMEFIFAGFLLTVIQKPLL
jgi:hypothetical protein